MSNSNTISNKKWRRVRDACVGVYSFAKILDVSVCLREEKWIQMPKTDIELEWLCFLLDTLYASYVDGRCIRKVYSQIFHTFFLIFFLCYFSFFSTSSFFRSQLYASFEFNFFYYHFEGKVNGIERTKLHSYAFKSKSIDVFVCVHVLAWTRKDLLILVIIFDWFLFSILL